MRLSEPVTTITDFILALESLLFCVLLARNVATASHISPRFLAGAFLLTGVAAAAGGTFHGFAGQIHGTIASLLWKVTVYAIGLSALCLLLAGFRATLLPPLGFHLSIVAVIPFLFYAYWMFHNNDFRYVIYFYTPVMLAVLVVFLFHFHLPGARWVIAFVVLSFAGAGIQQSGFRANQHFNHNDVYHLVQMFALWLLYKGGTLLRDR